MPRVSASSSPFRAWPVKLVGAFVALGITGAATLAQAALITTTPENETFSLSIGPLNAPFNQAPFTVSGGLQFNRFDGSLGTLQQVVVRWDTALTASLVNSGFDSSVFDPTPFIKASGDAEISGLGTLFDTDFVALVPINEESATINESVKGTRTYSAPADLAYFIGTGTFTTTVTLDVSPSSGNNSASMSASWQTPPRTGLFSVEYVYESSTVSVPEPEMLLLGTAAALAFGVAGWRRRIGAH